MAKLSVFIPPFSPDYSGVASAFFDLNAIAVLHDASGCTGNYTGYDEPRWYGSHSPIYCSGLREIDAILGDDQKLIDKVIAAENDIHADMIAIIGSPVPMVVGCDSKGIAAEIEAIAGVPAFGFDTTGTEYYDKGLWLAASALIERFTEQAGIIPDSVNLLGSDAIDFPVPGQIDSIRMMLQKNGIQVNASFPAGITREGLATLSSAALNIVISAGGIGAARVLKKRFGTPFIMGLPYGEKGGEAFLERVRRALRGELSGYADLSGNHSILVLGEAVASRSVAEALRLDYGLEGVAAASLFSPFSESRDLGISYVQDEAGAAKLLSSGWDLIIADPLYRELLQDADQHFLPLPLYAVSSKLHVRGIPDLSLGGFNEYFDGIRSLL